MYTGFTQPFKVNRPLTQLERDERLMRETPRVSAADEHASLVMSNSTYMDMVDRWFKIRGSMGSALSIVGVFLPISGLFVVIPPMFKSLDEFPIGLAAVFICFVMAAFFWAIILRKEFFTYTNYPVRFNRKNRTIYVFRHNGPDGVIRLSWDTAFFHLGHSKMTPGLVDVRGEILEGDTVKDTFAVGNYLGSEASIRELWEFIRRYMEDGPQSLGEVEITASVKPTLKNAYIMSAARSGIIDDTIRMYFMPFIAITTATRWLVMKSCKIPVWPADVEAECAIDPNDPYVLPVPAYTGQFSETDVHFDAKMDKLKQQQDERFKAEREKRKRKP